jgi:hypothetical protein
LIKALKKVLANPDDAQALKELNDLVERAKLLTAKMNAAIIEDQLAKNNENLKGLLEKLSDQVRKGDQSGASDTLAEIKDAVQRRIELGRALANEVTDPEFRKQITTACNDLEKGMPELVLATRNAVADPSNQHAMNA